MKVVLNMLFLTFSNVHISSAKKKLIWKIYITKKALLTTRWVKFIGQKKFAKAELDDNIKVFILHVSLLRSKITIPVAKS